MENDPDTYHFFVSIKENLWQAKQTLALKFLSGLLRFARFDKKYAIARFKPKTEAEEQQYYEDYNKLLLSSLTDDPDLDIASISFENATIAYLNRSVRIIPDLTSDYRIFELVKKLLDLYVVFEMAHSDRYQNHEDDQFANHLKLNLQDKIAEMILWNDNELSRDLFHYLLDKAHGFIPLWKKSTTGRMMEIYKFFRSAIENIILAADRSLPKDNNETSENTCRKFRAAWGVLLKYHYNHDSMLFADLLLLDIRVSWQSEATNWKPLEFDRKFYQAVLRAYGGLRLSSVVTLLSHIGDETLLMKNLQWLISIFKNPKIDPNYLQFGPLEQLITRVNQNHLTELLDDRPLFEDYLWLLDKMVELQSSDAYWIMEFLIGFK